MVKILKYGYYYRNDCVVLNGIPKEDGKFLNEQVIAYEDNQGNLKFIPKLDRSIQVPTTTEVGCSPSRLKRLHKLEDHIKAYLSGFNMQLQIL